MGCGGRKARGGANCAKGGQALCLTVAGKKIRCNHQTHAAMCRTCPAWDRRTDTCRGAACARCGGTPGGGVPVKARVKSGSCPLGRAPDARGRVTVNGKTYRGVPFRLRLVLWWRGEIPGVDQLAGCGCRDSWKRAAVRARWWWRGFRRRWEVRLVGAAIVVEALTAARLGVVPGEPPAAVSVGKSPRAKTVDNSDG